jgi:hypothetical protein
VEEGVGKVYFHNVFLEKVELKINMEMLQLLHAMMVVVAVVEERKL